MRTFPILTLWLLAGLVPAFGQQFGGMAAVGDEEVFVGETRNQAWPGIVYVFARDDGGAWAERARLTASDADGGADGFGRAIAVAGDRMVVGANLRDGETGAAYVFERGADGAWTETARLRAGATAAGDRFGTSVALHGDTILVAATRHGGAGAVYVFARDASGVWIETAVLAPSDGADGDLFGTGLAFDGGQALVGAPGKLDGAGAVYAFRAADGWTETGRLDASAPGEGGGFGTRILLHDGVALVGAPHARGDVGVVHTFAYDAGAGAWEPRAMLMPFDADRSRFGSALAFDGAEAWIGAPRGAGFRGALYRFRRDTTTGAWLGATKTADPSMPRRMGFAAAVAVRGDLAVVGLTGDDYGMGSARVYARDAGGAWTPEASLRGTVRNFEAVTGGRVTCEEGKADAFGCKDVDLLSFLPVQSIGGGRGVRTNDLWGWTDPETGREYALVGLTDAASFIDVTDPNHPVYLGILPMHEGARGSVWRDVKVYKDHAFIVSDGAGPHGMQVFDLTRLRDVENPPVVFHETAHYDKINSAHNVVINEDPGFAYVVGASMGGETCGGGLHMVDIRDPEHPAFAGCFGHTGTGRRGTGYTHDAQCVVYAGPDAEHRGKEICFGSNETALSIADVTDKKHPVALSVATYPKVGYTHQGWLTEDQRYFYMNDEGDEAQGLVPGTRTLIWDVSDLDDPQLVAEHVSDNRAIDHNLYVRGNLMYQSNYVSGLRILDVTDPENPVEVGYFDTVPYGEDSPQTGGGSWSNYPYFKSGIIVVTSGREGVFVLKKKDVDI
ncbi:choice-of-anchor B family protein [Rhodocaloribacter sp.]